MEPGTWAAAVPLFCGWPLSISFTWPAHSAALRGTGRDGKGLAGRPGPGGPQRTARPSGPVASSKLVEPIGRLLGRSPGRVRLGHRDHLQKSRKDEIAAVFSWRAIR